ncbi:unnamed protein product [Prorocentrum cordatum]|uniref:Cytochrome P450 n=1 Tax=Prorocentrum cordatum TaxID=2364126 RepID=A0ABN9XY22_9DINO|nr:unnamed protein product [Polarella glacialis]
MHPRPGSALHSSLLLVLCAVGLNNIGLFQELLTLRVSPCSHPGTMPREAAIIGGAAAAMASSGTVCSLGAAVFWFLWRVWRGRGAVPRASWEMPLLGHAMMYRRDPVGFLRRQLAATEGQVVTLNLAGLETVVIADQVAARQFATAPAAKLSIRAAVNEFGFGVGLGVLNVCLGTGVHVHALKSQLYPKLNARGVAGLSAATKAAVAQYMPMPPRGTAASCDWVPTMRRVFLHVSMTLFAGPAVLAEAGPDFIERYIAFQDQLEDAIAKGVVLPRWLAESAVLGPVARVRSELVEALCPAVEAEWARAGEADCPGMWTQAIRKLRKDANPGWRDYCADSAGAAGGGEYTAAEAAELILGLLFAAHKNPGIAAAQTALFLIDPSADPRHLEGVLEEVDQFGDEGDGLSPAQLSDRLPRLERAVYEALRLTAHTIGAIRKVLAPSGWTFSTSSGCTYKVPSGTFVAASHIAPHLDPQNFDRPDVFDPERFASEAGGRPGEYVLTTFSNGLHRCPGERLAVATITVALTTILGQYLLELPSPLPPLCFERATLAQRLGKVAVRYRSR